MQNPGGNFEALRESDINVITHRCFLDLQNYALTTQGASVVASSELSADWPAAGIINGDRTHINAGPASGAEDGIGLSTWQGNILADGAGNLTPNETITIALGQVRKINRIKIICWPHATKNNNIGAAVGLKDFLIEKNPLASGGAFSAWTGLADKNAEIGKLATTIASGQVTGNTDDMNVFEDATLQSVGQLRITISKLQSGSIRARIIEIEVTRSVDITEDLNNVNVNRRKDYRQNHRLASEVNLSLTNFDRQFSPNHVPNSTEMAAGYFNAELRPNLEIRYFQGFSNINCQLITAFIDRINIDANNRLATIKARDYFKFFIPKKITTNLKATKSLEYLVEFLSNLANFPSNMILLDTTTVTPALYMAKDVKILDEMNKLGDATGDAEVFMDEFGRLNFRSYLNVISHIYFLSSAADFQAGTNTNTDSVTAPGEVRLALSGPNYVAEGEWTSAISPALEGLLEYLLFETSQETGPATSIDWFIRVSADGINFTPWREAYPGTNMTKWNHWWNFFQVKARMRTSDPTQTPKVFSITVHYHSRGGSAKTQSVAVLNFLYNGTLLNMNQTLTDELGGANYLINKSVVKSKPTFRSSGTQVAWRATINNAYVSVSNLLTVTVGVQTFNVDLGDYQYDVPQAVTLTLGTATATASLSSHPSKPVLTLTVTGAGTITDLHIEGTPFVQEGTVEVITYGKQELIDLYGEREDVLENDFIDNKDMAEDISKSVIQRFQQPLTWLPDAQVRPTPNIQINDRSKIVEINSDLNNDFLPIAIQHEITTSEQSDLSAVTKLELVKIGDEGNIHEPAFYGGYFYFDGFKFGGARELVL